MEHIKRRNRDNNVEFSVIKSSNEALEFCCMLKTSLCNISHTWLRFQPSSEHCDNQLQLRGTSSALIYLFIIRIQHSQIYAQYSPNTLDYAEE